MRPATFWKNQFKSNVLLAAYKQYDKINILPLNFHMV